MSRNVKNTVHLYLLTSRVFDTIDHAILTDKLHSVGLSGHAINWFSNSQVELNVSNPLGPLLLTFLYKMVCRRVVF